ncbi:MAG: HEPN domain-containing protein [Deltaproteobacteria bacterium]|nr:HEPN domain-containing protein [Deltaproteobacteria bacterium]
MSNRSTDWLAQARHDLEHARSSVEAGHHDWSCFACHQAAEKAVKALFLHLGGDAWGHGISRLLKDLQHRMEVPPGLMEAAKRLDKHYIPTRYPNGFDTGSPRDYYTAGEAEQAIQDAEALYHLCEQSIR